jgi:hypothetical protein
VNGAAAYQPEINIYIEIAVAAIITLVFVFTSIATLRARHRDMSAWHVHLGAAIYGVIFGAVIGFIIVPLRVALMGGEMPPETAGFSGAGALILIIALRRGMLARLPFLGPQVKAYRRASLRRQIEGAQKQLDKLTPEKPE